MHCRRRTGSMVMSPDVRYAISDISANDLNLISLSARSQTRDGVDATWACMHETRGCLLTLGIGSASVVHSWLLPDISAAFGRNEYSRGVYVRCYLWLQSILLAVSAYDPVEIFKRAAGPCLAQHPRQSAHPRQLRGPGRSRDQLTIGCTASIVTIVPVSISMAKYTPCLGHIPR